MRRRTRGRGTLRTAEDHAAAYARARAEVAAELVDRYDPRWPHAIAERLAEDGTDPLTCLIARYWLRRGKPRGHAEASRRGWR